MDIRAMRLELAMKGINPARKRVTYYLLWKDLYEQGLSRYDGYRKIAKHYGVGVETVRQGVVAMEKEINNLIK